MKTINDLGALVKRQRPDLGLNHLSDEQAGLEVKRQFPGEYDQYVDITTQARVNELVDLYRPSLGRIASWWQRGKAESRVKLNEVLGQEKAQILQQGAMMAQLVHEGKIKQIEFEQFVAQHQFALFQMRSQITLIEKAVAEGWTLENHQAIKRAEHAHNLAKDIAEHQSWLKLGELDRQHDHNVELLQLQHKHEKKMAKLLSELKVREAEQIGSGELNRTITEYQERTRLAILSEEMGSLQKRVMVQELIDQCYIQIEDIKTNVLYLPETKTQMIADREEMIRFFKEGFGKEVKELHFLNK